MSRHTLVLSLPDLRRFFNISLKAGRFEMNWQFSLNLFKPTPVPSARLVEHGHFWEIGYKGYEFKRIRDAIVAAGWDIKEIRRVSELAWHTFFYLTQTQTVSV